MRHRLGMALRSTWRAMPWQGWVLLAVLYGGLLALTAATYVEWISDSRFYLAWSYRYLGYSEVEAAQLTRSYLVNMDGLVVCNFCWPEGYEHSFFHGESGAVSGPRLMYPLLSAPFVGLFGPPGMLVVPLLSYGVAVVALAVLAARLWGRWWGFAAGVLILLPVIASRFASFAMTDALALMFNVVLLLFLPLRRPTGRRDLVWFLVILGLGLFTRQFAVTVMFGVFLAWFVVWLRDGKFRNSWMPFVLGSAALTAVVLKVQDYAAARLLDGDALSLTARYQQVTADKFGVNGLASIPRVLTHMIRVDYDFVRRLDKLMIVLLVFALVACLWRFRSEISALLVGMAMPTLALSVVIVDPTYFRYFVPVVPLMVLSVLALLADMFNRPVCWPSRSTEAASGQEEAPRARTRTLHLVAWAMLGVVHLLMLYLVIHRVGGYTFFGVLAFTAVVPAMVVLAFHRFGAVAAIVAGLLLVLSPTMVHQAISRLFEALALLAVVGCVALLPHPAGPRHPDRRVLIAFGVLLGAALAVNHRAIVVALGMVVAWILASIERRQLRNGWTPFALVSLGLGGCAVVADLLIPARGAPYRVGLRFQFFGDPWLLQLSRDRVLYAVLLLTIVAIVFWRRSAWRWLAAGVVGAGLALLLFGGWGQRLGNLYLVFPMMILLVSEMVSGLVLGHRADDRLESERMSESEAFAVAGDAAVLRRTERVVGAANTRS